MNSISEVMAWLIKRNILSASMDVFVYLHIKIKIQTHFQSLFVFKNSQIPEITSLTLVVYFAKVKILLCIHDVLGLSLVFLLNVASK